MLFIVSSLILTIIDLIWLSLFMIPHFKGLVKSIQCDEEMTARIFPMITAYIFLVIGFYKFVVVDERSSMDAFLLGLVIYGVYESTNYAIFKNWTFKTFVIDTLWGGVLFLVTSVIISQGIKKGNK